MAGMLRRSGGILFSVVLVLGLAPAFAEPSTHQPRRR
jgi:hypothetical protein